MRELLLVTVLVAAALGVADASPAPTPRQARIYHRNPQDCADGKLNPLFMSDWWYDLNAAQAEHRIDAARAQAIQKRMLELVNELTLHNAENNPARVVAFCQKLNVLRPHWSQW
jgi:hypothetical protein